MNCKKCKAELEAGSTVCPHCNEPIPTEESKRLFAWRIAFIVAACLAGLLLLALLAGLIHYGVTGSFLPRKNDIYNKTSYSVSLEELNTTSGSKSFLNKMDKVVATMGEHKLTNATLQIYYWEIARSSGYVDVDWSQPLDEQIQDPDTNLTWQQFFLQKALESWQQDMVLADEAKKAGFQMPEDYAEEFKTLEQDLATQATSSGFSSALEMIQDRYGIGSDYQSYYDYLWTYYYGALYLQDLVQTLQVTDAEVEAYFQEHEESLKVGYNISITKDSGKLVDVRHILIVPEGGSKDESGNTVYSEAEWEACRVIAQGLLDQYLAGDKTEDSFAMLAAENTEDPGSVNNGGLYDYVAKGDMVEAFENWCFDEIRKPGDTGLVKTPYGYHVMYYVCGDEGWIRVCTTGAQNKKASDMLDGWVAAQTIEVNYRAIVLGEVEISATA